MTNYKQARQLERETIYINICCTIHILPSLEACAFPFRIWCHMWSVKGWVQHLSTVNKATFPMYVFLTNIQQSFKWKLEKLHKICNVKQPVITSSWWKVKGIVMCCSKSLSQQFKPIAIVCCLLACLHHDNTQPHTASHTVTQIYGLKLEVLLNLPFSPDLASSKFLLFWPLYDALHGQNFGLDEEVREGMQGLFGITIKTSSPMRFMLQWNAGGV